MDAEIPDSDIHLLRQLGAGCFGTVYKGECRETIVAVKIPLTQDLSAEELKDFRNEIQIMAYDISK